MADLLGLAAAWLRLRQRSYNARDVVYTNSAGTDATVKATPGRSEFDVSDDSGVLTRIETHDEIIDVADLEIEPSPGDKITVDGVIFSVRDVGSEPCWRFTDQYRIAYRIHTKEFDR